jgi:transposase
MGLPGLVLLAQVVLNKYVDHLPLHRQEAIFMRQWVGPRLRMAKTRAAILAVCLQI